MEEICADGPLLVVGAAGSIGSSVVDLLHEVPRASLIVADCNENGLAHLVRDLHASGLARPGISVDPVLIDITSPWADELADLARPLAATLNLAAVKHVRSERDALSMLRMIDVNVAGAGRLRRVQTASNPDGRYFAVSSDKAANPTSAMGASKRLMELTIAGGSGPVTSTCRFANVAFSAGSLLESWIRRIGNHQPISVPTGIQRFFMTPREAAELCAVTLCRSRNQVFVPQSDPTVGLRLLSDVLNDVLQALDLTPEFMADEREAVAKAPALASIGRQAVLLSAGDTSGEKQYEEFQGSDEPPAIPVIDVLAAIPLPPSPPADSASLALLHEATHGMIPSAEDLTRALAADVPTFHSRRNTTRLDDRL